MATSPSSTTTPVRVFLRVRPPPLTPCASSPAAASDIVVHASHAIMRGKTFHFDSCLGSLSTQRDVYAVVGPQVLDAACQGLNATLVAYGQSGSGKTYTMFGDGIGDAEQQQHADRGIVPRFLEDLFERVRREQSLPPITTSNSNDVAPPTASSAAGGAVVRYRISARMYEVYNEKAYDMLAPTRRRELPEVRIRDRSIIDGITEPIVTCAESALALLREGMQYRTSGVTRRNERSSRSHAVFQLLILREVATPPASPDSANDDGAATAAAQLHVTRTSSLVSLVDLAGSERYDDAATGGKDDALRVQQMVRINLSLSTLRRVIQTLADNAAAATATAQRPAEGGGGVFLPPYRDSLLTRALAAAFGGNSTTAVIVTVSPQSSHETYSSLQFGSVARRVVNRAVINVGAKDRLVGAMSEEIAALKAALAVREAELAQKQRLLDEAEGQRKRGAPRREVSVNDASAARLVQELQHQVARLEALRDEAQVEQEQHEALRRRLVDDIAAKDQRIVDLLRRVADERRARRRAVDGAIMARPDIVSAMESIKEPLLKTPGCPLCLSYRVEESTQGKALVRALAELAETETLLGEAQRDAVRYQSQVADLAHDLLAMQDRLNHTAALQRRCDEQQALLDMREAQIVKYLNEIAELQMRLLQTGAQASGDPPPSYDVDTAA